MTNIDIERLKARLEQMKKEHEEFKRKRVAAGLPEDAPVTFVEPTHAEALIERLRPLYEVLTDYLALTDKAHQIIPFDSSAFDKYRWDITLVHESKEGDHVFYAGCMRRAIEIVAEAQEGERTVEYVISKLYQFLSMANSCIERNRRPRRIHAYDGDDLEKIIGDYKAYYAEHIEEDRRLSREIARSKGDTNATTDVSSGIVG